MNEDQLKMHVKKYSTSKKSGGDKESNKKPENNESQPAFSLEHVHSMSELDKDALEALVHSFLCENVDLRKHASEMAGMVDSSLKLIELSRTIIEEQRDLINNYKDLLNMR